MRSHLAAVAFALAAVVTSNAFAPALAADTDGPDCGRVINDFGDAPEGNGSRFPTCLAVSPAGSQESACPAISTPPGPTGYVHHLQTGSGNYWLGCYLDAAGALTGIDSEADGKYNGTGSGPSDCAAGVIVDCDSGFPFHLGQDECRPGSSTPDDAGVEQLQDALACFPFSFRLRTANCGGQRQAYLNVLADWNHDEDWNDVVLCDPPDRPCIFEWSVKNLPIVIPPGCAIQDGPAILAGPDIGYSWVRVSLTDVPVDDDFPWAGSANRPGGFYPGGETEDYQVLVIRGDAVIPSTWGGVKIRYR